MNDWYANISGQQYGPVSQDELVLWIQQGRVRPEDLVWREGMPNWLPAGSVPALNPQGRQTPPPIYAPPIRHQPGYAPHRGVMILIFGIIGIMGSCVLFGVLAWVMGSGDLKKMQAGQMDPAGQGMTKAGMILGIISTVLGLVCVLIIFTVAVAQAGF